MDNNFSNKPVSSDENALSLIDSFFDSYLQLVSIHFALNRSDRLELIRILEDKFCIFDKFIEDLEIQMDVYSEIQSKFLNHE